MEHLRGSSTDHFFDETASGTRMIDVFAYAAPFGILGRAIEVMFLNAYMERFLADRAQHIKRAAEGVDWKKFV